MKRDDPSPEVARPSRSGLSGLSGTLKITKGENLPHWTVEGAIYHVAFRLADSVPTARREEWIREREEIVRAAKRAGRDLSAEEEDRIRYLYSERIESFLDAGHGECLLARPAIGMLVAGALGHFDGERYRLHSWSVMPNHVHAVVEPFGDHDLSKIIHSWKSFTAHEANKRLARNGDFWQHDAYNHIIRSEREYHFQVRYVWENPEKIGKRDWPWRFRLERPDRDGLATSFPATRRRPPPGSPTELDGHAGARVHLVLGPLSTDTVQSTTVPPARYSTDPSLVRWKLLTTSTGRGSVATRPS